MFSVYVLETVTWIKGSMHNYFHSGAGISKTEGCTLIPGVVTKDDTRASQKGCEMLSPLFATAVFWPQAPQVL